MQRNPHVDPPGSASGRIDGGDLTALALARNSDVFKAGVDFHGIHDWSYEFPVWFAEQPKRYQQYDQVAVMLAWLSSPESSIARWRSPVLLIQGDNDQEVTFFQLVDLVERLRQERTYISSSRRSQRNPHLFEIRFVATRRLRDRRVFRKLFTLMRRVLSVLLAAAFATPSLTLSASAAPSSYFGGLHYRLIGPFRGGRALAVTGVPGEPYHFYFGAVDGGVWESTNAGRTWSPILDAQDIGSIGAIAVAPSDPHTLYVGSGEADMARHRLWQRNV